MNTESTASSQFIIGAPSSNSGKTTVALGLLRLLRNKGLSVQPFKAGPDYIDPKFHEQACGKTGVNLDLYMMPEPHIRAQLHHIGSNQQVRCIEGVMGLFDGAQKAERSTAELAIKLEIPVVLVVDAKAVAYSVAPLIQGFKNFDSNLRFSGVIFNRVGSERHYSFLKEACDDIGVTSFGYVKRLERVQIPSRHLGLDITHLEQYDKTIDTIASEMGKTLDWQLLLRKTVCHAAVPPAPAMSQPGRKLRFAVAKDEAFGFIYPQHIQAMEALGSVTFFSPIRDENLPESDLVYFPGGYPECYLSELSANVSMLQEVKAFITNGGKVLAECGGMMYLGKSISDKEGNAYNMVNAFGFATSMEHRKMHLGYRNVSIGDIQLKGHEFHYSTFSEQNEQAARAEVTNAKQEGVNTDIYIKNKVIASYMHFYLGEEGVLEKLITYMDQL